MADSPVNIADFRCRGNKVRSYRNPIRISKSGCALAAIEPEPEYEYWEEETPKEAKDPDVLDISRGRESKRLRARTMLRAPLPPRHRSNVIRFGEPGVTIMSIRVKTSVSNDYDPVPAA
jgi:hypothetical protein